MATELEATRAAEARAAASLPAGPAPALEAVPVPLSEADEADRERTREVREVMRALTQLPQGLPTTLWGWDMAELARAIVDGERCTAPDGTPLVKVKGKWYNTDRTNVGVFVREWKEPVAQAAPKRTAMTAEERERKLEQLETALLEGKISEKTFQEPVSFFAKAMRRMDQGRVDKQFWEKVGRNCIGCGGCIYVCPMCSCFDVDDVMTSETEGARIRLWDTCDFAGFTREVSGHNPRPSRADRRKRWFYHKISMDYLEKNPVIGCVGCGRCVIACPGGVDMATVVRWMRKVE